MTDYKQNIQQFIKAAQATGTVVEQIQKTKEALTNSLQKIIKEYSRIVMADEEIISELLLPSFIESNKITLNPDKEELAGAEIGISYAFNGIAHSGSVCVNINSGLGSVVSLLPAKHVVILEEQNIVSRPRDLFNDATISNSVNQGGCVFITGSSATADMGELVKGAHGPAELHIILLD